MSKTNKPRGKKAVKAVKAWCLIGATEVIHAGNIIGTSKYARTLARRYGYSIVPVLITPIKKGK